MDEIKQEPTVSEQFDQKDIEDNKVMAAIGYIGILCLVPLLGGKNSPYCQFHGKQGLVLLIAWIAVFFLNVIPLLGWVLWYLASIILVIVSIIGIIKAYKGEKLELPVLADFAKKIKI